MNVVRKYFIRNRADYRGRYVIHKENCPFIPEEDQRINLGEFKSVEEVLKSGNEYFRNRVVCPFCLKDEGKMSSQVNRADVQVSEFILSDPAEFSTVCMMFCPVS
jgi:hypothetical protein